MNMNWVIADVLVLGKRIGVIEIINWTVVEEVIADVENIENPEDIFNATGALIFALDDP